MTRKAIRNPPSVIMDRRGGSSTANFLPAGKRGSWPTYGVRMHAYLRRHFVWPACTGTLDDTVHVLLHCPLHVRARTRPMTSVADALLPLGATLNGLGSDLDVCRLLLGSPPAHVAGFLATSSTAYRDILRASAAFLREVYITRWVHPRQNGQ